MPLRARIRLVSLACYRREVFRLTYSSEVKCRLIPLFSKRVFFECFLSALNVVRHSLFFFFSSWVYYPAENSGNSKAVQMHVGLGGQCLQAREVAEGFVQPGSGAGSCMSPDRIGWARGKEQQRWRLGSQTAYGRPAQLTQRTWARRGGSCTGKHRERTLHSCAFLR